MIHDRESIFSPQVDSDLRGFGIHVLKTPIRTPTANAFCERLLGTLRRECLDYLIPVSLRHLKAILKEFVAHYNRGRPHSPLGPGVGNHPRTKLQPVFIGTSFPLVVASGRHRSSVGCIMNTAWKRRLHSDGSIYCAPEGALEYKAEEDLNSER